jgi:UDP-N-acetylmuramoylalanine--D-glutamate ligase
MGIAPVLVDDEPPSASVGGSAVLRTDRGGLEALARCDVVVKTPGISRHRADVGRLVDRGVPVTGGLGLWMEEVDRDRVLCVTGTKGKSTTAVIAGHLLERLGYRCLVAGNIGRAPYDPDAGTAYDFWVVEISSFQATDLASSPPVVAVTSLHPDHLDWHGDAETYYRDKLSACTQPGARLTGADGSSALLREHRRLLPPAPPPPPRAPGGGGGGGGRALWREPRRLLAPAGGWVASGAPRLDGEWANALGLLGEHNHRNALIARACLAALGVPAAAPGTSADQEVLVEAAAGFDGLGSRLRPVGSVDGVAFVDDSLSTNVLSTLAALDAFAGRRVALVAGGFDRGIDYRPLAQGLARREAPTLVLTIPACGPRIHAAITDVVDEQGHAVAVPGLEVADFSGLAAATVAGFAWARPDGVVLLSPGAPSFGQFRDYRERAAAFVDAMRSCGTPT